MTTTKITKARIAKAQAHADRIAARMAPQTAALVAISATKLARLVPEDRGMTTEEFAAHHGRTPETDDILAAWRRLPAPARRARKG
jgi:hypothetical protein